jgi:hypothetical protein
MACESKNQALHSLHKLTGDHIINVTSRVAWKKRDGCECALWWPEQCPLVLSHALRWVFVGKNKRRIGRGGIKGTGGSQHARRREFQNLLDGKEGQCSTSHRVECWEQHGGGIGQHGSLPNPRHSSPKSAAKTGKVRHVGHWRAFLTTTPRTRADAWRGAAGPSHFPLTTVSRVSPSLSAPAFSVHLCRALPAAACTCVSRTIRSLHLWAE